MTSKKDIPLNKETKYTFQDFADIIRILRSPEGCPWDREQTFETMKQYLMSESEEVCLAVDRNDSENLCEELGDVLMEILLFSQIAADQNLFTIEDVINGISRKMIRRHPHVFGDTVIRTSAETEALWKEIKEKEKAEKKPVDSTNP
ncbi:MAG: MazG family protein [Lachnospiraceae bacterium]